MLTFRYTTEQIFTLLTLCSMIKKYHPSFEEVEYKKAVFFSKLFCGDTENGAYLDTRIQVELEDREV